MDKTDEDYERDKSKVSGILDNGITTLLAARKRQDRERILNASAVSLRPRNVRKSSVDATSNSASPAKKKNKKKIY